MSEQKSNGSWGGNLEIVAISELYDIGIKIFELGPSDELKTTFDNTLVAIAKGLRTLFLARHRRVHYDSVIQQNQKLPFLTEITYTQSRNHVMRDARDRLFSHSKADSVENLRMMGVGGAEINSDWRLVRYFGS